MKELKWLSCFSALRESTSPLLVTIVVSITSFAVWTTEYTKQTYVTREKGDKWPEGGTHATGSYFTHYRQIGWLLCRVKGTQMQPVGAQARNRRLGWQGTPVGQPPVAIWGAGDGTDLGTKHDELKNWKYFQIKSLSSSSWWKLVCCLILFCLVNGLVRTRFETIYVDAVSSYSIENSSPQSGYVTVRARCWNAVYHWTSANKHNHKSNLRIRPSHRLHNT